MESPTIQSYTVDLDSNNSKVTQWNNGSHIDEDINACSNERTFYFVCLSVLFLFGILANAVIFYTFQKKYMANATIYMVKSLAVVDSIFLTVSFIGVTLIKFNYSGLYSTYAKAVIAYILQYVLSSMSQFMCVWLVIPIAYYRYMAAAKPHHRQYYPRCTLIIMAIVDVIITSIRIPLSVTCNKIIPESFSCYPDYEIGSTLYWDIAYFAGCHFLFPLIPLLFLSYCLKQALKEHQRNNSATKRGKGRKESHDVTIIVAIIAIFVVTYGFYFLWSLSYIITPIQDYFYDRRCEGELFDYFVSLGTHINSSCNFFLYICFNKTFRQRFSELF